MTEKKDITLFHNYLLDFANNLKQYGKLWYNVYNLKYFVYDRPDKEKPYISRTIKINDDKMTVNLVPQTIFNKKEVEARYLGETEDDIFSFIMYSYSRNPQRMNGKDCVMITLKEINAIFKYNFKKIKQSLDLLSNYKVYFEYNKTYDGVLPVQFISGFIYDQKTKKTLVFLPPEISEFIYDNKFIIMNYQQLFNLKNRIAKLLYKRINITNVMNFENKVQYLKIPETLCNFLSQYGIEYKARYQKKRLFEETISGLDELKQNKIIEDYKLEPITGLNKSIIDYKLEMYLSKEFCLKFSASQKGKQLLEQV